MKAPAKSHFETPTALSHDANTLVSDMRHLVEATSEIADEKVAAARKRLSDAIEAGRDTVVNGAKIADSTLRAKPYQSIALAVGVGALIGFLAARRS